MNLAVIADTESRVGLSDPALVVDATVWQDIARRRRQEIYNALPPEYLIAPELLENDHVVDLPETCGLLSARELSITSLSATKLLQFMHNETYTAVEVITAFCKRAAIAHQAVSKRAPIAQVRRAN